MTDHPPGLSSDGGLSAAPPPMFSSVELNIVFGD
jgi:hypothetical protein